jgi:Rrf2 family protein
MISITSEYALRALCCLAAAAQRRDESILGRDLARQAEVPANYLAKILLNLRRAGMVSTARGTRGGYRLNRPAARIYLKEIVELFEGTSVLTACVLGRGRQCGIELCCSAHGAWHEVRTAYNHFLTATTLADITHSSTGAQPPTRLGH